jgi:sugar phosphate permease
MLTRTIASAQAVKPTNVRWIVLAGICALYFVTYLDRVNISLAAPSITAELRLSPTELEVRPTSRFFGTSRSRPG